ncbi:large-conductance mechanosensitive channel protein MscL [Secundilactobacillus yichangensis]|uniref:large-conductance mechanosensitive channel protein MscL n=1 Tax=Secundilactobacillus yichangensis TaxID=2799580 RepID=UPI001940F567|nr:large-conductance mechanosensitive channel protein MscL [Secundilactobacillus yichangensis]
MLKDFRTFIARGNVVDLAVGVIIGAAFTSIVTSLTKNLINPLIGLFIGKIDLSGLVFSVGDAHFRYGQFIDSIINFLIIAFVVFLLVKMINKLMHSTEKKPAAPSASEAYLKEIRDLLEQQQK